MVFYFKLVVRKGCKLQTLQGMKYYDWISNCESEWPLDYKSEAIHSRMGIANCETEWFGFSIVRARQFTTNGIWVTSVLPTRA